MKTINLLTSIFVLAITCLLSCERPPTTTIPPENDSTKTIQDSIANNLDTTNNSDTTELREERHVASVYLVNHLDKPIDLEMHHDSVPSPIREILQWYREAGIQKFTLQPNDTVYCDSVVYLMDDNVIYVQFPGVSVYNGFVDSYFFVKINYNNQQYEYTNKADIRNLLFAPNYWYIVFDEEKKKSFGWE